MKSGTNKPALCAVLDGEERKPPPIWLMRQAGRYLPEYQAVRREATSFWTMCMDPERAAEVTLQPIRRFDFDAAIIFSDILVIAHALGQKVGFEDGVGPVLENFPGLAALDRDPDLWAERLAPAYGALRKVRESLAPSKALIGFAGAPWTLAAYMIEGGGSPDQKKAKLLAYREPEVFSDLIHLLCEAVASHLIRQIDAGADAVQLFDSWAGGLPVRSFETWVLAPAKIIVARVRARHPKARIIGFPRAVSESAYARYAGETGVDAVSIDTAMPMDRAVALFGESLAIQGNCDPLALIAGGDTLNRAVDDILFAAKGKRLIFNLGHGILPETPLEHVAQLVARVRRSGG